MGLVYAESLAGTSYTGAADVQDNDDRQRFTPDGLLVDQGDGRAFLPTSIRSAGIAPGDYFTVTYADASTETITVKTVDRLDDSFSFVYDD